MNCVSLFLWGPGQRNPFLWASVCLELTPSSPCLSLMLQNSRIGTVLERTMERIEENYKLKGSRKHKSFSQSSWPKGWFSYILYNKEKSYFQITFICVLNVCMVVSFCPLLCICKCMCICVNTHTPTYIKGLVWTLESNLQVLSFYHVKSG